MTDKLKDKFEFEVPQGQLLLIGFVDGEVTGVSSWSPEEVEKQIQEYESSGKTDRVIIINFDDRKVENRIYK